MISHKRNNLLSVITVSLVLFFVWICEKPAQSVSYPDSWKNPLASNDVRIRPHDIAIPLGYIFLIKKDNSILGAVRFKESWTGWVEDHVYTSYESWYQPDGSGNFSKENVEHIKKTAWIWGWGHRKYLFNFDNAVVHCGPIKLPWAFKGLVDFFPIDPMAPYTVKCCVDLAPTKWTEIKDVNAQDASLKWYTYEKDRPIMDIHIDELW